MKSKRASFKERTLSDRLLPFVYDITEDNIDEMNEVSISTFDKGIDDINNPAAVRTLWEKGFNRKLTSIFVNIIKNQDAYVALMKDGYTTIHVDPKDNIVITIYEFFMNDYNFERTDLDNNTREFTFYYSIKDDSAEDNPELLKGKFDLDISIMYIDPESYEDITQDEVDYDQDCYEITYDISNRIFFNKYITEDYDNDDFDMIIRKEVMILKALFNDLDYEKIQSILTTKIKTEKDIIIE
jgi:hypothetical protein